MGRATIIGGGTDGLFTVSLDYGVAERHALIDDKNARVSELTTQITDQTALVEAATAAKAVALENLNVAIQALAVAQAADQDGSHAAEKVAVDSATVAARAAAANEAALKVPRDLLKAAKKSLQREIGYLQGALVSETRQAWCVDLTESASGAVATVDVPGETETILLAPGCRAPGGGDGQFIAREILSPAQAFYNAAILPGWQKWMPTYRKGTITSVNVDFNTAGVSLDAAISSALGVGVNQQTSLANVPVSYMTCNASVFSIGDRCIVEFLGQSQEFPRVIGFVDNPKSCSALVVNYQVLIYATPAYGCIFPPSVLIGNNNNVYYSQSGFYGFDCEEVSLINTDQVGNEFAGWSDGVVSENRTDLDITESKSLTAVVYSTPIRIAANLVSGVSETSPYVTWYAFVDPGVSSDDYDIISLPETRFQSNGFQPGPEFYDFTGETITIGASVNGIYKTISFVISHATTSYGTQYIVTTRI